MLSVACAEFLIQALYAECRYADKMTLSAGACAGGSSEGGVAELGLPNVAGVFIVTVFGCLLAV